jgi:hypothetical protein
MFVILLTFAVGGKPVGNVSQFLAGTCEHALNDQSLLGVRLEGHDDLRPKSELLSTPSS